MDKANLIISIIIVLCIATAVAAYGIINNQNAIFSDLSSMDSGSGSSGSNGIGNNTTSTSTSSGSGSGSSGSSGGSGSSSGAGSGSSSGRSGSGSGSGGSGSGLVHTSAEIRAIAMNHVEVSGCYAGTPRYSGGYWYVTIYNSTDNTVVSGFAINDRTGHVDLA